MQMIARFFYPFFYCLLMHRKINGADNNILSVELIVYFTVITGSSERFFCYGSPLCCCSMKA
ncbi:hypothetical protein CXF72_05720 [Psychromonas sp. MB-3u-54]|nr:hypothetical protein CXF72_05720 [Psychromonas sp. MB-3u-54]